MVKSMSDYFKYNACVLVEANALNADYTTIGVYDCPDDAMKALSDLCDDMEASYGDLEKGWFTIGELTYQLIPIKGKLKFN